MNIKHIILLAGLLTLACSCYRKVQFDPEPWYRDDSDNDPREPVRVMSFNVRYQAADDTGIKAWANRKEGVFEMLRATRPMTFGVQEMDEQQLNEILESMTEYAVVRGEWSGVINSGAYNSIFYLKDSLDVERSATFWLSETPDEMSAVPGCTNYRIATWGVFRKKKSGKRFIHLNTHLENGSQIKHDNIRYQEMVALSTRMGEINTESLPWVMTADWNTAESDQIFNILIEEHGALSARATAKRSDNSRTFNNYGTTATAQYDHIFYGGFAAASVFKTVTERWGGLAFISDHYPVYADLRFEQ